jgi:hypothetical protein
MTGIVGACLRSVLVSTVVVGNSNSPYEQWLAGAVSCWQC